MRILVSGGGTAGHVAPILAVVDALKQRNPEAEFLYVGQAGGMEARIATAAGLTFASINAGKYRRIPHASTLRKLTDVRNLVLNLRDLGRVGQGIVQSLGIIRAFRPSVIFIKGGFVGLPVGIAARLLRVPYLIHESDITPGLTNKVLAGNARRIAVGFPVSHYAAWPADRLVFTGNPVRQEILTAHRLEGLSHFRLSDRLPVILILGGSQGARNLNTALLAALPQLTQHHSVLHVSGESLYDEVVASSKRLDLAHPERYMVRPFLSHDLPQALAAADLVVSRAGAGSIAELAVLAKPVILVPNDEMAAHQLVNARSLGRSGAAKVIPDSKLTPEGLIAQIEQILSSETEQADLSRRIAAYAHLDAADRLAGEILEIGQERD